MPPFVRPFLAVSQTTLRGPDGERLPFKGLFATRALPKGAFLGFYNGTFKEGSYGGRNSYVFSLSDFHVIPRMQRGKVSEILDPLAMTNEPSASGQANVYAHEFSSANGVLPHLPGRTQIAAIGFFTCADVPAGSELFVHYGDKYSRADYPNPDELPDHLLVGKACKLKKAERSFRRHDARLRPTLRGPGVLRNL